MILLTKYYNLLFTSWTSKTNIVSDLYATLDICIQVIKQTLKDPGKGL